MENKQQIVQELTKLLSDGEKVRAQTHNSLGVTTCDYSMFRGWKSYIVRAEEWTPSYAGGCERMDFLLKNLQTVIKVKKTRPKMTMKSLGEELIIDIEKYKAHPDCKQLYCFVYDPDGFLGNPKAIKNDLEKSHEGFVKIFIRPEM